MPANFSSPSMCQLRPFLSELKGGIVNKFQMVIFLAKNSTSLQRQAHYPSFGRATHWMILL